MDRLRLRELGTLLFVSRSLEREESELALLDESESDDESESESPVEPEPEPELEPELEDRLAFFRLVGFSLRSSLAFSFSLSFSLASRIRLAVPVFVLNSSGTSTDGFPSALTIFASTLGFSSCCVRDGRETYGRLDLHS